MNKIQRKLLLVFLMTVSVIAGYAIFMVKNVAYLSSQPEYITLNGNGNEVLSEVKLQNINSSKKGRAYKSAPDADLATEVNAAGSDHLSGLSAPGANVKNNNITGRNNYNHLSNKKTMPEVVTSSGGAVNGLLAFGGGKGQSDNSSGFGVSPSSLAGTTQDLLNTSTRQLAKGGNGNGGGHPGGDPDVPVGEGWWILILLTAGYAFLRHK